MYLLDPYPVYLYLYMNMKKTLLIGVFLWTLTGCLNVQTNPDSHKLYCNVRGEKEEYIEGIKVAVEAYNTETELTELRENVTDSEGITDFGFYNLYGSMIYTFTLTDTDSLSHRNYKTMRDTLYIGYQGGLQLTLNLYFDLEGINSNTNN